MHAAVPEVREPAGHLSRGLVGERDDEDVARSDDAGGEGPGDPPRDDPGLARAGAGQDAQRPGRDRDGRALVRIEVGEQRVGVGQHESSGLIVAAACPGCTRDHPAILAGVELRGRLVTLRPAVLGGCAGPRRDPRRAGRRCLVGTVGLRTGSRPTCSGPDPDEEAFVIERDGAMVGLHPGVRGGRARVPSRRFGPVHHDGRPGTRASAPDAIRALAAHLIDDRGHHRLTIDPAAANSRAIAAYAKVGFRPVGVMRRYQRMADGTWVDALLMDLLAEEFVALTRRTSEKSGLPAVRGSLGWARPVAAHSVGRV